MLSVTVVELSFVTLKPPPPDSDPLEDARLELAEGAVRAALADDADAFDDVLAVLGVRLDLLALALVPADRVAGVFSGLDATARPG